MMRSFLLFALVLPARAQNFCSGSPSVSNVILAVPDRCLSVPGGEDKTHEYPNQVLCESRPERKWESAKTCKEYSDDLMAKYNENNQTCSAVIDQYGQTLTMAMGKGAVKCCVGGAATLCLSPVDNNFCATASDFEPDKQLHAAQCETWVDGVTDKSAALTTKVDCEATSRMMWVEELTCAGALQQKMGIASWSAETCSAPNGLAELRLKGKKLIRSPTTPWEDVIHAYGLWECCKSGVTVCGDSKTCESAGDTFSDNGCSNTDNNPETPTDNTCGPTCKAAIAKITENCPAMSRPSMATLIADCGFEECTQAENTAIKTKSGSNGPSWFCEGVSDACLHAKLESDGITNETKKKQAIANAQALCDCPQAVDPAYKCGSGCPTPTSVPTCADVEKQIAGCASDCIPCMHAYLRTQASDGPCTAPTDTTKKDDKKDDVSPGSCAALSALLIALPALLAALF